MTDHPDIVERLSLSSFDPLLCQDYSDTMLEAAAEFTRLRAEAEALRKAHRGILGIALSARNINSKYCGDWMKDMEAVEKMAYDALDAAIAKATGEQA